MFSSRSNFIRMFKKFGNFVINTCSPFASGIVAQIPAD